MMAVSGWDFCFMSRPSIVVLLDFVSFFVRCIFIYIYIHIRTCWDWEINITNVWPALPLGLLSCVLSAGFITTEKTCFPSRLIIITDRATWSSLFGHCGFRLVCVIRSWKAPLFALRMEQKAIITTRLFWFRNCLQIELKCMKWGLVLWLHICVWLFKLTDMTMYLPVLVCLLIRKWTKMAFHACFSCWGFIFPQFWSFHAIKKTCRL